MDQKISKLVEALQEFGIDCGADEVADWLWYTAQQNRSVNTSDRIPRSSSQGRQDHAKSHFPKETDPQPSVKPVKVKSENKAEVHLPQDSKDQAAASGNRGLPFRMPGALALPHAGEFMRAMRPLRRRVPGLSKLDIDEEATAQQIADINLWIPVIHPELVRWLDVMLVVDSSPSMAPWRQTTAEFRRMLEQQGAFRDVRVWRLKTSGSTQDLGLYSEKGHSQRHYKELVNTAQPRLIMVITDCVSPAWTSAKLIRWLQAWGREHPVALVQVLPQRLWSQTCLGHAHLMRVVGHGSATPNQRLQQLQERTPWRQETKPEQSPIPLLCLNAHSVRQWASSITGSPNVVLPAFAFQAKAHHHRAPDSAITIDERLRRFREVASPTAFKLACFLAAAPLRLPVMRLVQRALLPESHQEHFAEFLLSGLIRRVGSEGSQEDPDRVAYEFLSDSVRDKLLDAGLVTDAVQVQEVVSRFIADHEGGGIDFLALISSPENVGELRFPVGQEGFAKITAKVLKRLGKRYFEVARMLEAGGHDTRKVPSRAMRGLPRSLGQLARLRRLNLSHNRLTAVPEFIADLSRLQSLDLSANQLTALPTSLCQLTTLRMLNLSHNRLAVFPEDVAHLSQLESLDLSVNELTNIPSSLANLENLQVLKLEGNPLNPELAAAYHDGLNAVRRYLRSRSEAQVILNEAKLILVGEGEVGKSSLVAALRGERWDEGRHTTQGIEIKPLRLTDSKTGMEITLNAWDFGGQRVYRPTHQLFFSAPAVYLVVWKPRDGPHQGFVKEWIKLVKHREPEAKILIVATHGGPTKNQPDLDHQEFWDLFGSETVVGFFHVDSKPDSRTGEQRGIVELRQAIAGVAANLPEVGRSVPKRWHEVREALKQTDEAYLSLDQVLKICAAHKIPEEEAQDFVRISHRLGHLIHYSHDPRLKDLVILKPDWLATAVSFVLDDGETREKHGLVKFSRLEKLWSDKKRSPEFRYPARVHPIFMALMERFDLSHRVADSSPDGKSDPQILIPQLVPDVRPVDLERVWPSEVPAGDIEQVQICRIVDEKGQSAAAEGLFYQLIVRLHKFSLGREDFNKSVHWQRGLILDDDYNGRALLEHIGNDVRITVRAAYPGNLLAVLTREVKWLVENFWEGLKCQVVVPCVEPCGKKQPGTGMFEVQRLIESKRKGRPEYPCGVCNEWQNIDSVLQNAPAARRPSIESLLAESFRETWSKLDVVDQNQRRMMSQVDDAFHSFMQTITDEGKEAPRLFSLEPVEGSAFNPDGWTKKRFRVTLWCEHTRLPLPLLNKNDKEGVYEFDVTHEWFAAAAPFLKVLLSTLSLVLPVAASATKLALDEATYKVLEKQLDLGRACADAMLKASRKTAEWLTERDGPDAERTGLRAQTGVLREFQALLKQADPGFGDLRKVMNKQKEFLWVHRDFEPEY